MKIPALFLISFLLVPLAANCYGQTANNQSPEAFIQIEVRDSKGGFTAYIEGKPEIFAADLVIKFLESKSQKTTILKDGKEFEKIQYVETDHFSTAHAMAGYQLSLQRHGVTFTILWFSHDGYPVFSGDSAKVVLTILRLKS